MLNNNIVIIDIVWVFILIYLWLVKKLSVGLIILYVKLIISIGKIVKIGEWYSKINKINISSIVVINNFIFVWLNKLIVFVWIFIGFDNWICKLDLFIFCLNGFLFILLFIIFLNFLRFFFNIFVLVDLLKNIGVINDVLFFDVFFDNICFGIVLNGGNVDCFFKGLDFNFL